MMSRFTSEWRTRLTFCSIDTVGVHYSATIWRWYRNWVGNADAITAKYGQRWYRVRNLHFMRAARCG